MPFVLASASPRRRELLGSVGLVPRVQPTQVDETPHPDEPPLRYAQRVASLKAEACSAEVPVLAADTVVALDGALLTKARDTAEAAEFLTRLSGRVHAVHTAVVLKSPSGALHRRTVSSTVRFRTLSSGEIERYVASGEPMDKAGAYGIQGHGGALVAEVHGSYSNVVGLPLEETLQLLALVGIRAP